MPEGEEVVVHLPVTLTHSEQQHWYAPELQRPREEPFPEPQRQHLQLEEQQPSEQPQELPAQWQFPPSFPLVQSLDAPEQPQRMPQAPLVLPASQSSDQASAPSEDSCVASAPRPHRLPRRLALQSEAGGAPQHAKALENRATAYSEGQRERMEGGVGGVGFVLQLLVLALCVKAGPRLPKRTFWPRGSRLGRGRPHDHEGVKRRLGPLLGTRPLRQRAQLLVP